MNSEQITPTWNASAPISASFPTILEIEKWFDEKFCSIKECSIFFTPDRESSENVKKVQQVMEGLRTKKARWLREGDNEAWYAQRMVIVQSAWEHMRNRHDVVVAGMEFKIGKGEEELKAAHATIETLRETIKGQTKMLEEHRDRQHSVMECARDLWQVAKKVKSIRSMVNKLMTASGQSVHGKEGRRVNL